MLLWRAPRVAYPVGLCTLAASIAFPSSEWSTLWITTVLSAMTAISSPRVGATFGNAVVRGVIGAVIGVALLTFRNDGVGGFSVAAIVGAFGGAFVGVLLVPIVFLRERRAAASYDLILMYVGLVASSSGFLIHRTPAILAMTLGLMGVLLCALSIASLAMRVWTLRSIRRGRVPGMRIEPRWEDELASVPRCFPFGKQRGALVITTHDGPFRDAKVAVARVPL